jgi:hypothetical protein
MATVTDGALPLSASSSYGSETEVENFDASDASIVSLTDKTIVVSINFYNRIHDGKAVIYDSSTAAIAGLTDLSTYYIIKSSTTTATTGTIALATSYDNAILGIDVPFSGTQSSFGSSTAPHTLTSTARSRDTTTWDEDMAYGCVCDSSWEVGLASGQRQLTEFYGPDCSLIRCPSNDDPITESEAITAVVHSEDTAYPTNGGVAFDASKVLADDSDRHRFIWLGADTSSSWFILTLTEAFSTQRGAHGAPFRVASFQLRNTKNDQGGSNYFLPQDERSTTGYTIHLSTDASAWTLVKTGSLNPSDLTLQTVYPSVDMDATYVKFTIISYDGDGGGLGYFAAFINNDETDCTNIVAPGGFGTGAWSNKCHVECSNRGLCDSGTGVCECYPGFTGEDCFIVSAAHGSA